MYRLRMLPSGHTLLACFLAGMRAREFTAEFVRHHRLVLLLKSAAAASVVVAVMIEAIGHIVVEIFVHIVVARVVSFVLAVRRMVLAAVALQTATGGIPTPHVGTGAGGSSSDLPWNDNNKEKYQKSRYKGRR